MFREQIYSGPADPQDVCLGWAALLDDPSWLDRDEQIEFDLRRARATATTSTRS